MEPLTMRIRHIKQPYGGYISRKDFPPEAFDDGKRLNEKENIHGVNVGLIVDYMTRFMLTDDKDDAFSVSCRGAENAAQLGYPSFLRTAKNALAQKQGLDDNSLIGAYTLSRFDVWYRNPMLAIVYEYGAEDRKKPDKDTIENLRIMINRSVEFIKQQGKLVQTGFDLREGCNATVFAADGDYLFRNSICDLKVLRSPIKKDERLQLVCYWLMGLHTGRKEFSKIDHLTIYNPRLNIAYRYDVAKMTPELRATIEREVLGYEA